LLIAEKALLIRDDLAGMLLRQLMPRLPQLMLLYGPTSASDNVQHTGISRDSFWADEENAGEQKLHQIPRCNQSFVGGLDVSQNRSLHQAFRSLTDGTNV